MVGIIIFLWWIGWGINLSAQVVIEGIVRSAKTRKPIPGASVYLEKARRGVVTRADGSFRLERIPAGADVLIVRSLGYQRYRQALQLYAGDTVRLIVTLQEVAIETQPVVVAASKRTQLVQDVPVSVSTVGFEHIQLRAHTQLDQVLRYVPGVYVTRDQINIRGTSGFALGIGSRTFVLLDGFPFLAADGGDVKFDALPLFVARRLEVVKGGGSALYGSGAVGGVVNLVTMSPVSEQPVVRVRVHGGFYALPKYPSWQYRSTVPRFASIDAGWMQRWRTTGWVLAAGYDVDEGYHAFYDSQRYRLFGKLQWQWREHQLNMILNWALNDRADWVYWRSLRYATLPPETVDTNRRIISAKAFAGLQWQSTPTPTIATDLKISLYRTAFETMSNGKRATDFHSIANSWNGEGQLTMTPVDSLTITGGAQVIWNQVVEGFVGQRNQRLVAIYGQIEWQKQQWTVTAGTRWDLELLDVPEIQRSEFSPKIGIVYQSSEAWQLRLSIGKGFRIPTIGERFSGLRYGPFWVRENPDLLPEENWSVEVGGQYQWFWGEELWQVEVSGFANFLRNLVEPRLRAGATIQFVNVPRALVQGVELQLNGWLPERWLGMQISVLALHPWNQSEETFLKYRSRWLVQTRWIAPLDEAVRIEVEYRYQKRFDAVDHEVAQIIPDADARVDVHLLDLRLVADIEYWLDLPLKVVLNVDNALNYYYTEVLANLAPLRSISLQVAMAIR